MENTKKPVVKRVGKIVKRLIAALPRHLTGKPSIETAAIDVAQDAPQQIQPAAIPFLSQHVPHVFATHPETAIPLCDALNGYLAVKDEPSDLSTDQIRVVNFYMQVAAANKLPAGDYIELGSHRGYSLRMIHRFMDPTRTLYSLDTFQGFDQRDIDKESAIYRHDWTAGSFAPTSVERVARYVGDGQWPENLKVIAGWFPATFKGLEEKRWRFVHIDFDLYQPIKSALEMLWEPLLPGGVMMIHDYGSYGFPAARQAVDEFCGKIGILPVELSDRWSTAVMRKPLKA